MQTKWSFLVKSGIVAGCIILAAGNGVTGEKNVQK